MILFLPINLFRQLHSYIFINIRIYISICPYLYLSVYISISLSISPYLYISVYLPISLYLYLSVYFAISLSICLYLYISAYQLISLSLCPYLYISIYLSISLYLHLSVHLYILTSITIPVSHFFHYPHLPLHLSITRYQHIFARPSTDINIYSFTYIQIYPSLRERMLVQRYYPGPGLVNRNAG